MGSFKEKIRVSAVVANGNLPAMEEIEAWVDTGAVRTVVPVEALGKCGIKKMGTKKALVSAEGKTFERNRGSAQLSIQGVMLQGW